MNQKGWIFRNSVANLSAEFLYFKEFKKQEIVWYHEIKEVKLLHKKDKTLSGALITSAVLILNLLYFWQPYGSRIQILLAIMASASFLVGYWYPFTEVKVRIYYKNNKNEDFKINKKKYRRYLEIVNLVQRTIESNELKLNNKMVLHDWSLSAV